MMRSVLIGQPTIHPAPGLFHAPWVLDILAAEKNLTRFLWCSTTRTLSTVAILVFPPQHSTGAVRESVRRSVYG